MLSSIVPPLLFPPFMVHRGHNRNEALSNNGVTQKAWDDFLSRLNPVVAKGYFDKTPRLYAGFAIIAVSGAIVLFSSSPRGKESSGINVFMFVPLVLFLIYYGGLRWLADHNHSVDLQVIHVDR